MKIAEEKLKEFKKNKEKVYKEHAGTLERMRTERQA
jgi:hypothetical protein